MTWLTFKTSFTTTNAFSTRLRWAGGHMIQIKIFY
jgi:hypothetical protein